MDIIKYCEKAVSKDDTRYNITGIYRDKHAFVATDGHRLHYVDQPKVDKTYYLAGIDGQYPDWSQVMPKNHDFVSAIKLDTCPENKVITKLLKVAKALSVEIYTYDSYKACCCNLHVENNALFVSVNNGIDTANLYLCDIKHENYTDPHCYNLTFILEALVPYSTNLKLQFNGKAPLHITQEYSGITYNALIMPIINK